MNTKKVLLTIALCLMIAWVIMPISCAEEKATETPTSTDFKTYSNYGFSFEYPRGFTINEMGMLQSEANDASGLVQAMRGDEELLQVLWMGMTKDFWELGGGLSVALEDSFAGLAMDETIVSIERGEIVETTKEGYQMLYQDYFATVTVGDNFGGIIACFYCDKAERLYQLITGHTESTTKQDRLTYFQRFSDSLICH